MRFSVRSLLIWLMVLAVPVQAIAASGMQHCGPGHQMMQAGLTAASSADEHEQAQDGAPHEHPQAATVPADQQTADDVSDTTLKAGALGNDYTCSACANCCSAVGLPSTVVRLPEPPIAAHASALSASALLSFVPGGLDRPPRTFLA